MLEVSSPGLDRPLLDSRDFKRCINRKIRVFLHSQEEGRSEISGVLISVQEAGVNLDSKGQVQFIPFEQIKKAKQIID